MSPVANPLLIEPRRDLTDPAGKKVMNSHFSSLIGTKMASKTWYFLIDFDVFLPFSSLLYGKNEFLDRHI